MEDTLTFLWTIASKNKALLTKSMNLSPVTGTGKETNWFTRQVKSDLSSLNHPIPKKEKKDGISQESLESAIVFLQISMGIKNLYKDAETYDSSKGFLKINICLRNVILEDSSTG